MQSRRSGGIAISKGGGHPLNMVIGRPPRELYKEKTSERVNIQMIDYAHNILL